jgi:hypothetical protein
MDLNITDNAKVMPPIGLYIKYLNIASHRFELTMDECRDKFGLYTNEEWARLFTE